MTVVVAFNSKSEAEYLAGQTKQLPVDIRHVTLDVPWDEITARRGGRLERVTNATPVVADALRDAEVVFGFALPGDTAKLASKLRWVETPATGFDQLNGSGVLERRDIVVTTVGGLFAPWVAEQTFAILLGLSRKLQIFNAAQQRKEWTGRGMELRLLHGSTLAIVGLGNIGQAVARVGTAFGMRVIGTQRRSGEVPPGVERVYPRAELRAMLSEADVVVLAVAGTPDTVRLIGAAELAAMRKDALLINVARGPVVDEAALIDALREQRIGGAGLDVFGQEPLPADNPLWTLPNVLITPHVAANVQRKLHYSVGHFIDNLRRYCAGTPVADQIAR